MLFNADFILAGFISSLVFLLGHCVWLSQWEGDKPIEKAEKPEGEQMRPYLFLKAFYINPKDPRGLLPKINPKLGMTVNFRKKTQVYLFLGFLFLVLLFTGLLVYTEL